MPDPISTANINDLRRAVNNYRLSIGLSRRSWTNDPITQATPVREVHFNELQRLAAPLMAAALLMVAQSRHQSP